MKVGYVRVSTAEQNTGRQEIELKEVVGVEKMFIDKLSGKNTDRPALQEMLNFLREKDELYISEFSRLARSTEDLLRIVKELTERGIKVVSLKEKLDTSTPAGKLMLTVFAAIAEFERALMLQRQAEGIALAKLQGKYKGKVKKKKPADWTDLLHQYQCRDIKTITELAKKCRCSRPTLLMWMKEEGLKTNPEPEQLKSTKRTRKSID